MCSQDARCGIGIEPIEHEMEVKDVKKGDDLQGGQAQPPPKSRPKLPTIMPQTPSSQKSLFLACVLSMRI